MTLFTEGMLAAPAAWHQFGLDAIIGPACGHTCSSPDFIMYIDRKTYWRRQLRRTVLLLSVWAVVGFGFSILFVEQLNRIRVGEMPLGFWMAQQGSIYVFIVLIFLYAVLSGRSDRQAGLEEERQGRLDGPLPIGETEE